MDIIYIQHEVKQYMKFVKPSYEEWVLPYKKYSDIIIPNIKQYINDYE